MYSMQLLMYAVRTIDAFYAFINYSMEFAIVSFPRWWNEMKANSGAWDYQLNSG